LSLFMATKWAEAYLRKMVMIRSSYEPRRVSRHDA
jgi:hypothetical protein